MHETLTTSFEITKKPELVKRAKLKSYDLPYIQQACAILESNPRRHLTITALALEVGINSFKLRVGFKEFYKKTIHQYRLDLRLKLAKEMLEETDLTISEIAYKTGFDSREGFTRRFRKQFSKSPRDFRKYQENSIKSSKCPDMFALAI